MPVVFAIAAHPDDIEFHMAGTLLLLGRAGWELHYLNLASGNCGSTVMNASQTRRARRAEAKAAARLLGAHWHPPLGDDLEIFYELRTLRRLAALVREVKPDVVLTHPTVDYMEDHMNTARLALTATFARCIPNFLTTPQRKAYLADCTVYHCMPHGLHDPLGVRVTPQYLVDTTAVQNQKRDALACHRSQKEWLDATQGMDSYLLAMESMSAELEKLSPLQDQDGRGLAPAPASWVLWSRGRSAPGRAWDPLSPDMNLGRGRRWSFSGAFVFPAEPWMT